MRPTSSVRLILFVPLLWASCSTPEWKRRAALLPAEFPRPPAQGARCLDDKTLAQGLVAAVRSVDFAQTWDYGPLYGVGCPASSEKHPVCASLIGPVTAQRFPQIDLSVVAFNDPACAVRVAKATVVFDRAHRDGFVARHDDKTLNVTNVRFRQWDEARHNGGRDVPREVLASRGEPEAARVEPNSELAFDAPYPDGTLLHTDAAPDAPSTLDFMSPWPASSFKLMVATRVLKLLDAGDAKGEDGQPVTLATPIALPTEDLVGACPAEPRTLTLRQALETMLQWSGNCATAGLVRFLHRQRAITQSPSVGPQGYPLEPPLYNSLNELLRDLGLSTLQMNRTIEVSGRWGNPNDNYDTKTASVANNHMTSWDAARLIWLWSSDLLEPAERPSWRVGSAPVNVDFVSKKTRALLIDILRDSYSGHHLVSNRTCAKSAVGTPAFGLSPEPGLPGLLSNKWLNGNRMRHPFGDHPYPKVVDDVGPDDEHFTSADLSPCQRVAEVEYLNKPGLTNVAGSSVGLVRGLDRGFLRGRFARRYIVSFFSSLGSRYGDAARLRPLSPGQTRPPTSLNTTQRIPLLGARLDAWLATWLEKR
jgi:hypothetical protein